MNDLTFATILVIVGIGVIIGFLPTIVAMWRGCKATAGIFVINLFLGWTLLGWVGALAWAASGETRNNRA
jgi:hypothetical protein